MVSSWELSQDSTALGIFAHIVVCMHDNHFPIKSPHAVTIRTWAKKLLQERK